MGTEIILVLGILTVLTALFRSSKPVVLKRVLLGGTQRCMIVSFTQERQPTKIVGVLAYLETPLLSPLSGRECAYYEIHVDGRSPNSPDGEWHTLVRESRGQGFLLEDETGRCIVDPTLAEIAISVDWRSESNPQSRPTKLERALLLRAGDKGKGWIANKTIRYREGILEAGELVSAFGRGTMELDPDGVTKVIGYREGPPCRLRMYGTATLPLLISDEPGTMS